MKRRATARDVLPLSKVKRPAAGLPTGEAFRSEWIDFERGIRVGNLEPHERITRILKYWLETTYGTPFITDRWGRGVFWQWICWLPRENREAKPVSNRVNFGCAKLFISILRPRRIFQCGLQVERGFLADDPSEAGWALKPDWDWHRLLARCSRGSPLDEELGRLILREGFEAAVPGARDALLAKDSFTSALQIRQAARSCPRGEWAGFQLYYPMQEAEVRGSSGYELVRGILAAFTEVAGVMSLCMDVPLAPRGKTPRLG